MLKWKQLNETVCHDDGSTLRPVVLPELCRPSQSVSHLVILVIGSHVKGVGIKRGPEFIPEMGEERSFTERGKCFAFRLKANSALPSPKKGLFMDLF